MNKRTAVLDFKPLRRKAQLENAAEDMYAVLNDVRAWMKNRNTLMPRAQYERLYSTVCAVIKQADGD